MDYVSLSQERPEKTKGAPSIQLLLSGAGGFAVANVFGVLLLQVAVKRFAAAIECNADMHAIKQCDPKLRLAHSERSSLLRRAEARSKTGAGCCDEISACAKHT